MNWDYTFELAETESEARDMLGQLYREGWEALSCSRRNAAIELFVRRQLAAATVGSFHPSPFEIIG